MLHHLGYWDINETLERQSDMQVMQWPEIAYT
jgi:hypothetical protein